MGENALDQRLQPTRCSTVLYSQCLFAVALAITGRVGSPARGWTAIRWEAQRAEPDNWKGKYYAVVDERGELVGFFCFEKEDDAVVIGLGLKPDCTGEGLGQAFVEAGLGYARQGFDPATFRLSVATFNQRAIRVYEKVGFKPDGTFIDEANGSQHEFLRMVREG